MSLASPAARGLALDYARAFCARRAISFRITNGAAIEAIVAAALAPRWLFMPVQRAAAAPAIEQPDEAGAAAPQEQVGE